MVVCLVVGFCSVWGSLNSGWIHPFIVSLLSTLPSDLITTTVQPLPQLKTGFKWKLASGESWQNLTSRPGSLGGRLGADVKTRDDLLNLKKPSKQQLKNWRQTDATLSAIIINVSLGLISGKTHLLGWMFLSFSFCPSLFCSHNQQWFSLFPGLNSISHNGSWHHLSRHRDVLGTAKPIRVARGRIIICWINETCVKLNCLSNTPSTLLLHVSEEMGTI